ncbi:hypothetical protein JOM56_004193 [Amanita muscaria]
MQPSAEEQAEQANAHILAAMMGGNLEEDMEIARKVLRKHNGNIEKAADAILQGDKGEDLWQSFSAQNTGGRTNSPAQIPPAPSSRVIDLTADDDEMSRALQLSMETPQNQVRFGPSDRAPDPAWQMVSSNLNVESAGQEDQHLKEAIQASLKDFPPEEPDVLPFEDTIREGGRPVALRAEAPELAYAALAFHALFHVPQVREHVAMMPLPYVELDAANEVNGSYTRALVNIVEYFSNLDLAQLSAIVDKDLLTSLQAQPIDRSMARVTDATAEFLRSLAGLISRHLNDHKEENETVSRLFYFRHTTVEYRPNIPRKFKRTSPDDGFVVLVDVGVENIPNDLIGTLSANLSRYSDSASSHDVIIEPSDVLAFQLVYRRQSSSRSNVDPFIYPKTLFLDRFLLSNVELANQKRRQEKDMNAEIVNLTTQKETLTRYNNRDTLADLRTTLYYYEHVASSADPERERQIGETITKLRSALAAITDQLNAIDRCIEQLRSEVTILFDCPELQHYRYDLRAVLVHTGLPGRKQIYSYVQDVDGIWWKTVDFTVTEVTEEMVLTDPNGLHLGAGPYLLLYSRSMPQERIKCLMPWPSEFLESVEQSNKTFLDMVPPELAAKVKTSPPISAPESTESLNTS